MMRLVVLSVLAVVFARPAVAPAEELQPVASAQQVLNEVNATRATRGLPPFILDENLTRAAMSCAVFRARNRIEGHTPNDFGFLPPGVHASAAGCAAWPAGMGWGSCCTYDNYRFAGAAFCDGPDGRRYMHLFVR